MSNIEALLASINGTPVLAPDDLAAAIVEGRRDGRLGEVAAALAAKPAPKIPPRYESEIRTWLSRSGIDEDPAAARTQAYAAVHLDPHNSEAISALDDASLRLGDGVRRDTWEALVYSYPDVPAVQAAATRAGVLMPDPVSVARAVKRIRTRTEPAAQERRERHKPKPKKRPRGVGLSSLLPVLEPDPVKADRMAAIHLACGNKWRTSDAASFSQDEPDPLTWAAGRLDGKGMADLPAASATAAMVSLMRGEPDEDGSDDPGPRYGRLIKRVKGHPAVVAWAVQRQLDAGDIGGAQKAYARIEQDRSRVWEPLLSPIDAVLAVAGGDVDSGWAQWEAGTLAPSLRPFLARGLLAAGRDGQADEVLGLPEVPAARLDDPELLRMRFDVLFKEADVSEALEQAMRLVELRPASAGAVGRLWLALAADGRLTELADRAGADVVAVGEDAARILASVRGELEARVRRATGALAAAVVSARSELQQLAKGRTIRAPEAFEEAAQRARETLADIEARFSALGAIISGEETQTKVPADDDLVALVAAARGWLAQVRGGTLTLDVRELPASVLDNAVVADLTGPAREIGARAVEFAASARDAAEQLASAVEESRRDDLARRRVEERVSKLARNAADALSAVVAALAPGATDADDTRGEAADPEDQADGDDNPSTSL